MPVGGRAVRPPRPRHESNRFRLWRQRRNADRLEGRLEPAPFRIGQGRFPGAAYGGAARLVGSRRGIGRCRLDHCIHDAQEVFATPLVRVAVALDQTSEERDLQGETEVAGGLADAALEEPANARLAVGEGDDRSNLARNGRRPEELAEHARAVAAAASLPDALRGLITQSVLGIVGQAERSLTGASVLWTGQSRF